MNTQWYCPQCGAIKHKKVDLNKLKVYKIICPACNTKMRLVKARLTKADKELKGGTS